MFQQYDVSDFVRTAGSDPINFALASPSGRTVLNLNFPTIAVEGHLNARVTGDLIRVPQANPGEHVSDAVRLENFLDSHRS